MQKTEHNNVLGIFYMLIHVIAMAALYAILKAYTKGLEPVLIVFLYKAAILIIIAPWCLKNGIKGLYTKRFGLHVFRGINSMLAQVCMFCSIQHIVLSDVAALQYIEQILVMIIAIFYFKEKATTPKFIGIAASFTGALLIVRPDYNNFNLYYLFVFMAILLYAVNNTAIKILGRTEKTRVQLFLVTLISTVFSFPMALMQWETVAHLGGLPVKLPFAFANITDLGLQIHHLYVILVLAFCYLIHSICHFKALKIAELSTVIPIEYTKLIFTGIFGYILLSEGIPEEHKLLGYALIIGSGLYLLYNEKRKRKLVVIDTD